MRRRPISHSEASALLDCQAKHDFGYVGRLAGAALVPKATPLLLRQGRAWGRGVAAFHEGVAAEESAGQTHVRITAAMAASLEEDAVQLREAGLYLPEEHEAMREELEQMLAHYISTTDRLPIERPEHQLLVSLPLRGWRFWRRYLFEAYIDGIHIDQHGHWLVEYKLRRRLASLEQITLSRQIRWYAWAWRERSGIAPVGVIVDERLNALPGEVAFNKDGRPSRRQSCTPEAYLAAGGKDQAVIDELKGKRWQQRERVFLRPDELDEAGEQLQSVAEQLRQFDSGALYPVRNPSQARCPGCQFRDICPNPTDFDLVTALYETVPAKRDREEISA